MILGIGIDIVDVRRIESIIVRWQESFIRRVFTDSEIKYCNNKKNPAQRFATRFAAKEALIKALFPRGEFGIDYKDIEVGEKDRRPIINLFGEAKKIAAKKNIKNIHIMLSHDGDYGIANVVIEA
ncbi:MAG: holo-[acyl-carrier-protein] synthase [Deltaproteobacteria bacterium CG07_land_8_20_14_0_80_38_7]|nr:MAG: holo-[acyl-carrier-protein] synthase [Deltaproteobacteria bacterium CG07_land_8_20_14_0_80_38_7]